MKWNRDSIVRRARIELKNGEKAIREQLDILREKADREIDRHVKDALESNVSTTEPSGKSTGVLYGVPSETTTESIAQFAPREIADDADDGRGSPDDTAASIPLLADIDSQDPSPLPIPAQLVPFAEPQPEVTLYVTNVLPLVDVSLEVQDFPPQQSSVAYNALSRLENLDGEAINSPITSNSEPFVGSSTGAMPVAEIMAPARSIAATSTETPTGSHTRRTWGSRVPSADAVISRSPQIDTAPGPSTPNLADSHPVSEPPTLIKVTGYRILNTAVVLLLGVWKGVASYRGESILSNTLDILMGVVFAVGLYWLGFLETSDPPCLIWLFHKDYTAPLRRSNSLTQRLPTSRCTAPASLPFTSHEV